MADAYTFPGGSSGYIPQLHADLVVRYSRSPDKFAINRYIGYRKVDKMRGYWLKFRNDDQDKVVAQSDVVWNDGNDAPVLTQGNASFEFKSYECVRRAYVRLLGQLALEQSAYDLMAVEANAMAQQAMTARSRRLHSTLTTAANWGSNSTTATALGGGTWANATAALPYIRKTIFSAFIEIQKATLDVVEIADLHVVMNPVTAKLVASSPEFVTTFQQFPGVLDVWQADAQYGAYGIPSKLFGCNIEVDCTTYNSSLPGAATTTHAYSFPDNVICILSKKDEIKPDGSPAFSTITVPVFEEFQTESFADPIQRRTTLRIVEALDDSYIMAPESGYLVDVSA